jgi:serine/threonine protein kinase, bacterial
LVIDHQPAYLGKFATFNNPTGLTVDYKQFLIYVADTGNSVIRVIDNNNVQKVVTTYAGNGATGYNGDNLPAVKTSLNSPMTVGIPQSGYGNTVYIADRLNYRIRYVYDNSPTASPVSSSSSSEANPLLRYSYAGIWLIIGKATSMYDAISARCLT